MPLVPAICTQCGAQIEVDNTHEAGICKHCGTAFITEKAINNYNTYITNHIHTDKVVIGTNSVDELVNDAYKCLDRGAYDVVFTLYRKIQKEFPADYRGYWLQCIYETHNFNPNKSKDNYAYPIHSDPIQASVIFRTAYNLAPDTEKNNMLHRYREYIRLYNIKVDDFNRKKQEKLREEAKRKEEDYQKTKEKAFKILVIKPVRNLLICAVIVTVIYWSLPRILWAVLLLFYAPALGAILLSLNNIRKNWNKWKKDSKLYIREPESYLSYFEEK